MSWVRPKHLSYEVGCSTWSHALVGVSFTSPYQTSYRRFASLWWGAGSGSVSKLKERSEKWCGSAAHSRGLRVGGWVRGGQTLQKADVLLSEPRSTIVLDPYHCGTDPDPDLRIRPYHWVTDPALFVSGFKHVVEGSYVDVPNSYQQAVRMALF